MKNKYSAASNSEGGTMLATMILGVLLMAIVAGVARMTFATSHNAARGNRLVSAQAAAEGVLEVMFSRWRASCRANAGLPTTEALATINGVENAPTSQPYPNLSGFTIKQHSLIPVDEFNNPASNPPPTVALNLVGRPGWVAARSSNYLGKVTLEAPGIGKPVQITLVRNFQKGEAPIFQAAIFYEGKLEFHPGSRMEVNGLVHSNGDLTAASTGPKDARLLNFINNVSYTGNYKAGNDKVDGRDHQGLPVYASSAQLNKVDRLDPFGDEPANIFKKNDQAVNTNNDSFRELIERPGIGEDPEAIGGLRFYNQAGLKILIDTSKGPKEDISAKIYNGAGTEITDPAIVSAVTSALSKPAAVQDNREAATMHLTSFDISKLQSAITAMANAVDIKNRTYNEVVYIADVTKGISTGVKKGIRLINGSKLPGDLTIATENPVYIQGDYNTGGPSTNVASNQTNSKSPRSKFENPTAPDYVRKSSAVLADAVTILSNAWSDDYAGTTAARTAKNTTVNTAIFAGNVPTTAAGYSGGVQNFPRFLENWTGYNLTYYGSMVCMFNSEVATGRFTTNVYKQPARWWFFDNNFVDNPPPGTLASISYSRGRWRRE